MRPPAELEKFKREHLLEIDKLSTVKGIWLEMGIYIRSDKKTSCIQPFQRQAAAETAARYDF